MLTEEPAALHDRQRSPGNSLSPGQNGGSRSAWKGKAPMYRRGSWGHSQSPQSVDHPYDASDPAQERPSLLARMQLPLNERISTARPSVGDPHVANHVGSASAEDGEIEPREEGEDSPVELENLQDAPHTPSASASSSRLSGIPLKAEETLAVIPDPSPTKEQRAGRNRGSRSTIDVFGEPVVPESEAKMSAQRECSHERSRSLVVGSDSPPAMSLGPGSRRIFSPQPTTSILSTLTAGQEAGLFSSPPPLSRSHSAISTSSGHSAPTAHIHMTNPGDAAPGPRTAYVATPPSETKSPSFPPSVLEQCRKLLGPLISDNAKVRNPAVDEGRVRQRAQALLTDERCAEFITLAMAARKQTQTQIGPKRTRPHSEDPSEPPSKVPRLGTLEREAQSRCEVAENRTYSASEAEVDQLMGSERESESPGIAIEVIAETSAPGLEGSAQPLPVSRAPTPWKPAGEQLLDPDLIAGSTKDDGDTMQRRSDVGSVRPAPGTDKSREHVSDAQEATSSLQSTTISSIGAHPTTSIPPPASNITSSAEAVAKTTPKDATSADPSHYEPVTLFINEPASTDEPVVPPNDNDMDKSENKQALQEESLIPCIVPGLWSALVGRTSPGIETYDFFVDDATANATACWARRRDSFSLNERHVAVHLLCLPQAAVASVFPSLPPDATPANIAAALWDIEPDWPSQGQLVVQLNWPPEQDDGGQSGRTWLPLDLMPDAPHLDITPWIRRGNNTIHLIELAPLSDRFFVIHAVEPSETERQAVRQANVAWSHVARWTSQSPRRNPPSIAMSTPIMT